jgi:hypothetical protein
MTRPVTPESILSNLWSALGGAEASVDAVVFEGGNLGGLPSVYAVAHAAAAQVAASSVADGPRRARRTGRARLHARRGRGLARTCRLGVGSARARPMPGPDRRLHARVATTAGAARQRCTGVGQRVGEARRSGGPATGRQAPRRMSRRARRRRRRRSSFRPGRRSRRLLSPHMRRAGMNDKAFMSLNERRPQPRRPRLNSFAS